MLACGNSLTILIYALIHPIIRVIRANRKQTACGDLTGINKFLSRFKIGKWQFS